MNLDATSLFVSLVVSTIGFSYVIYGRKRPAPVFLVAGLLMMAITYFVESAWLELGLSAVLTAAPFFIR